MIEKKVYALVLTCGLYAPCTSAGSLSLDEGQLPTGPVEYVNASGLEIGIGGELFRLDSGFQIHGLPGKDRIQQLGELEPGMRVQYRTAGSGSDTRGAIRELWVQPD